MVSKKRRKEELKKGFLRGWAMMCRMLDIKPDFVKLRITFSSGLSIDSLIELLENVKRKIVKSEQPRLVVYTLPSYTPGSKFVNIKIYLCELLVPTMKIGTALMVHEGAEACYNIIRKKKRLDDKREISELVGEYAKDVYRKKRKMASDVSIDTDLPAHKDPYLLAAVLIHRITQWPLEEQKMLFKNLFYMKYKEDDDHKEIFSKASGGKLEFTGEELRAIMKEIGVEVEE